MVGVLVGVLVGGWQEDAPRCSLNLSSPEKDESSEVPGEMLGKYSNAPHAPAVLSTLASLRFFRTYLSNARPSLLM